MSNRKKVLKAVNERQLFSVMNRTKWEQLQVFAVNELPFPPPYQVKFVLSDTPIPERFDSDVSYWGDWEQGLGAFYAIEWLKVRPRFLKYRGKLIDSEIIDVTTDFINRLQNLKIPFMQEDDAIIIWGYVKNTGIFN